MQRGHYRNTRGGYRGGRGGRGGSLTPLKGLFEGGIWKCNCTPRLVAEHFKVKKDGPNQGRWFYTCQKGEKERCDFFLWEEDAQLRMKTTVMSNSRNETRQDPRAQEGWSAGRRTTRGRGIFARTSPQRVVREDTPTPSPKAPSPSISAAHSSKKRNAFEAQLDDNDDDDDALQPWALTGEEEAELAMVANTSMLETPKKEQKIGVYDTPGTTGRKSERKLPWLQEPLTPTSAKKKKPNTVADYFTSPKQVKFAVPNDTPVAEHKTPETPETPQPPQNLATPKSPSLFARYKDALVNPADSGSSLTSEVLSELSPIKLPPEKLSSLRSILSKHDLRTQGVTKGRDISRLALKAKEAKVAELDARIASLEAERERDRSVIARLRWKREHDLDDDDDDDDHESPL